MELLENKMIEIAEQISKIRKKYAQVLNEKINQELRRGTTALYGRGMYKKQEKEI